MYINIYENLPKEAQIRNNGGKRIFLHAQCRAKEFYEKQGYRSYGAFPDLLFTLSFF